MLHTQQAGQVTAVVLGDLDLARPLRAAGIEVTIVAREGDPARLSRLRLGWLDDVRPRETDLLDTLQAYAKRQSAPPVLFFQSDEDLAFVLRHRAVLEQSFRFTLAETDLVTTLMDKASFQEQADRLGLPVPAARVVGIGSGVTEPGFPFPGIVKPFGQGLGWEATTTFDGAKACLVRDQAELNRVLQRVSDHYHRLLLQQLIPGPETRVESYHAFVADDGRVVGEFTGRKLRTHPAAYGFTTALTTTDEPDVRAAGRAAMAALGVRGVAKLDFKRDDGGRLWLLEVNPRFNLWHHVGAVAGCNLPALVFAELTGQPRPSTRRGRAGVTWCRLPRDYLVARQAGSAVHDYLRWLRTCDAIAGAIPSDPWPFLRGRLWPLLRDRLGGPGRQPERLGRAAPEPDA